VQSQAREYKQITLTLPKDIQATGTECAPTFSKHLYSTPKGDYSMGKPTCWERHVLEAEIGREDLIAWYRNPPGGDRAIRVPYFIGETEKAQYPDFVLIYNTADGVKTRIVVPLNYNLSNIIPKWQGLALYSRKHETNVHRVDAVIETPEGELLSLDLLNSTVQKAILKVEGADGIMNMFKKYGGKFNR
jgi:hypothetical protein